MTKHERVRAALAGAATDRPPYGFWTHLPGLDLDPDRLADATAAFARRFDLDFVKAMPNGLYPVEDWGCACEFGDVAAGGVARVTRPAVTTAADWRRLAPLDVTRGAYGRELRHLRRLVAALDGAAPVLATVFSPLTVAAKLSNGASCAHLRGAPDELLGGLGTIAATTAAFARAAVEAGCAGIFLAVQDADPARIAPGEYRRFGEDFDRVVLAAARAAGSWFDVIHMHGDAVLFDLLAAYPVDALNWHVWEAAPTIAAARAAHGPRPVLGGLRRTSITARDMGAIRADLARARRESGGRGLLVAPGCVIRHPVDDAILDATAAIICGDA